MNWRAYILGVFACAMIMLVLVVTRLDLSIDEEPKLKLEKVNVAEMATPPPPVELEKSPPAQPPIPPIEVSPIPSPVVVSNSDVLELQPVEIPALEIDTFSIDSAPAPIRKTTPTGPSTPIKTRPRIVRKDVYDAGELDSVPRPISHGSFAWPRNLRTVRKGEVTMKVEIDAKGRCRVLSVVKASHPKLAKSAKQCARGTLFTPPKFKGLAVKSTYTWTLELKKP